MTGRRFSVQMLLLQPSTEPDGTSASPKRHVRKAQLVAASGGRAEGEAVRSDASTRVYNVQRPPPGFGTLWSCEVAGRAWAVDDVAPARNMRNVARVTISTTQPSGAPA